jgi:hypothetical protein
MNRVRGKEVSIAGAQPVSFVTYTKLQFAADDPVRLFFSVCVWFIPGAGRVAPLKDTIAFAFEALFEMRCLRKLLLIPSFDLNIQWLIVFGITRSNGEEQWDGPSGAPERECSK